MENSKRVLFLVVSIRRVQYILNLIRSPLLGVQLQIFRRQFEYSSVEEAASVLRASVPEVRLLFSQVELLVRLLLVVPVTLCEAERSFSSIRQLKTWLRSSATQKRLNLNNLAVCSTHRDPVDCLDLKKLVNTFTSSNERRLPTVNFLRK